MYYIIEAWDDDRKEFAPADEAPDFVEAVRIAMLIAKQDGLTDDQIKIKRVSA